MVWRQFAAWRVDGPSAHAFAAIVRFLFRGLLRHPQRAANFSGGSMQLCIARNVNGTD